MFCKLAFLTALIGIGQSQLFPGIGSLPGAISKAAKTALSAADLAKVDNAWSSFKNTASYANPAELAKRKDIFTKNWQLVAQQASDFLAGKTSFQLRLNDFADLVLSEFNDFFNGYGKPPKRANAPAPVAAPPAAAGALPQSVDWREKGAVSPVKHQNKCAGCYAFSATGALEGHNFRKNNVLVELSPQNLIDCTKSYSNLGCAGGYVDESFNYVKDHGINVYDKYPFEAKDGNCRFDSKSSAASAKGCVLLPEGDEKALAEAVATKGPMSVAIDARLPTMQLYGGGVYYDEKCKNSGDDLNHAVLVVGYGAEKDGTKYWLIKNSYGPKWGEDGYLKLAKDRNNHCGVATAAYYPVV